MYFFWTYRSPIKSWWANYRWHIAKPSEELGLKSNGWKKSFFRSGWQSKILEVDSIDKAKKCLQNLQNGNIVAFGGRFRGAIYDKNAELIIKQAKRSLKLAIKEYEKSADVNVNETAIVPSSYYNWGVIIGAGIVLIFMIVIGFLLWQRKLKKNNGKISF